MLFLRPYCLTRNSTNGSAVKWSRDTGGDTCPVTHFYITFSRQEHHIKLSLVRDQELKWLSAYTPFHFSFTVPLDHMVCSRNVP